jgi:cytochrome c oxidase subunit III
MHDTLDLSCPLPVGSAAKQASGWWGMWGLIATEAALFAYLLFSYGYLAMRAQGPWLHELPKFRIALPNTILLLASSLVLYWAETGIRKGRKGRLVAGLAITLVMGVAFVLAQVAEWKDKHMMPWDSAYASSYFTITGFHMLHVIVGLLVLAALLLWSALGKFGSQRHAAVSIGALYWHFVDVVWLAVFFTLYVIPHLG